jgi:hypothetical protein
MEFTGGENVRDIFFLSPPARLLFFAVCRCETG